MMRICPKTHRICEFTGCTDLSRTCDYSQHFTNIVETIPIIKSESEDELWNEVIKNVSSDIQERDFKFIRKALISQFTITRR